jgi:parvulin-like peptidyl-prolyl isomerase
MIRKGFRVIFGERPSWRARAGMIAGGLCVLAACGIARYFWAPAAAKAQVAAPPAPANSDSAANPYANIEPPTQSHELIPSHSPIPKVVAAINGHSIMRDELAAECRIHYGREVLESMVNKYLILAECRQLGIVISRGDIEKEIGQMAASFNLPVDKWLTLLLQERGIKPEQYADDIIWPTLALRKLAGERLQVTDKEILDAFEMEYGPAVKVRLIVCKTAEKARDVQARAAANPAGFGTLAMDCSDDAPSASIKGLVPPVRRHGPCPEIEKAAFSLADGQVSPVIESDHQFIILKREGLIEARKITPAQATPRLEKIIRDRKMRQVSKDIFQELQKKSRVVNVYNNPRLREQVGDSVVALINNAPIYLRQLDEECVIRHGADVLQGVIGQRMLEMACQQNQVTVSHQEMDEEIARDAAQMAKTLPDGKPDARGWLSLACKQQNVTEDVYCREVIWPAVALRKLTLSIIKIEVTDDDLKKGFEANYGPRVQCLAIVLNNLRRAQEVWKQADDWNKLGADHQRAPLKTTEEFFGDLAETYSIERSSKALRGKIPPIRLNGGQPNLEQEAFALKPGAISSVIQLDDNLYTILYCLGFTKPIEVKFEEVKKDIYEDVYDKKLRLAMADYYERLKDMTTVDNFLEPSASHSPKLDPARGGAAQRASYESPTRQ